MKPTLLLVAALQLTMLHAAVAPASRPNNASTFSDYHAVQSTEAYDGHLAKFHKQQFVTLNMDKLSEQGGLFFNIFYSNSICLFNRASVLIKKGALL